jgi:hypothetical protein
MHKRLDSQRTTSTVFTFNLLSSFFQSWGRFWLPMEDSSFISLAVSFCSKISHKRALPLKTFFL